MIPNPSAPPLRQALAVIFDHPELLTLDPQRARSVQELIAGRENPHFADVWQYISGHPLGGDDPWAELVPIAGAGGRPVTDETGGTLYQWALTPGMGDTIRQPLATALQLTRTVPWPDPAATSATVAGVPPRFGLTVASLGVDPGTHTCTLQLQSSSPRHVSVYVELFADGRPVPPAAWTSRLPPAAQDFLETATVKYLGIVPPVSPVAGMAVAAGPTSLSFALPDPATAARVVFGGIGLGNLDLMVAAPGVMLTAVLDHALPSILDGAGVALAKTGWFEGVLADPAVVAEVLAAGRFLFCGAAPVDTPTLLRTLAANLGALLLGGALPRLSASIAESVGAQAVAHAAPVLGWAETELAVQAGQRLQAQTSTRVLSCPASFWLDLVPGACTLRPDPRHGVWPDQATGYQVDVTYGADPVATLSGALPGSADAPIDILLPLLPAGGQVTIAASVMGAAGQVCGVAEAPATFVPPADQATTAGGLVLSEAAVSIGPSTRYRHQRALTFDAATRTHRWQDGPAPTAVGLVPAPGAAFRSLVGITVNETSGDVGYAWQEGGPAGRYALQSVGVVDPEARLRFSGPVFAVQPELLYDRGDPSEPGGGAGWNFYLDPATYALDGRYHLLGVTLEGRVPFDLGPGPSWGAFPDLPSSLTVHPAGWVVACFQEQGVVEILSRPSAAVPVADAPTAAFILGPGPGVGSVAGPVAAAVTSTGSVLVLEQDNARVQAIDAYGNPVAAFKGPSPLLELRPEAGPAQYLDLAVGPADTLYVLLCLGHSPRSQDYCLDLYRPDGSFLSRTTGVAAGHLVVDVWGRVYTLDYEGFPGPDDRSEPSVSQWLPDGS